MITIKEIAELAKVSTGTVDRVLHNRAGVSKKTAERIKALLKEHQFKLNDVASKLANRKKYNLATLLPQFDVKNSFWKSPYLGVLKGKEEVGFYGVQTSNFHFDQFDAASYVLRFEELMKSKPDAVVLAPIFKNETKKIVAQLDAEEIPYVFLNIDIEGYNNLSYIGQNSVKSGKLAAKLMHLCSNENDEFLIIKLRKNINNYTALSDRIIGFSSYFDEKKIPMKIHSLTFDSLGDEELISQELENFMKINSKIQGVYMPSSQIAALVDCFSSEKLKGLSVIGHDTTERNLEALNADKVSFLISQKSFEQGYDAVSVISDYLLQNKEPKQKIYSPLEIITKENIDSKF